MLNIMILPRVPTNVSYFYAAVSIRLKTLHIRKQANLLIEDNIPNCQDPSVHSPPHEDFTADLQAIPDEYDDVRHQPERRTTHRDYDEMSSDSEVSINIQSATRQDLIKLCHKQQLDYQHLLVENRELKKRVADLELASLAWAFWGRSSSYESLLAVSSRRALEDDMGRRMKSKAGVKRSATSAPGEGATGQLADIAGGPLRVVRGEMHADGTQSLPSAGLQYPPSSVESSSTPGEGGGQDTQSAEVPFAERLFVVMEGGYVRIVGADGPLGPIGQIPDFASSDDDETDELDASDAEVASSPDLPAQQDPVMNLDGARISGTRVHEAVGQDVQQADIIQESGMDSASDGEIREDGHAVRPLGHVSLDIVLPPDFAVSDMVVAYAYDIVS
ncbi:hypothetical protein EUX98_g6167 [Antrodiella citrinella]|uniref:Uncharacterized protein n=1 Tax=Antrodiella citrinella TaxID=2447956 RepID=A0A4S4MSA3_9APHY|nr:hypothetical protein EUX98_g6167 [Antrodiella citrinella]